MKDRRLQIGVMGSAADQNYSEEMERLALEIGEEIAKAGHILIYGANRDTDTLPNVAARAAKKAGGLCVGVTYGRDRRVIYGRESADVIIATGSERGGGREFVLVHSCDAIIMLAGGAGTLTEVTIAYQMNTPIVALTGTGGWADKLAGGYIDVRERVKILAAQTPAEAVRLAVRACEQLPH